MDDPENAETPPGPARKTIQSVANDAIREGRTNEEALERVLAEFSYARTSKATIGKFRRILITAGENVPTAAQARAEAQGRQSSAPPCRPKRKTPGSLALDALRDGKTTEQVIETVKEEFPHARMTRNMVSSYRDRLRGRGEAVPTAQEAIAAASVGFDRLVADLEEAKAARSAMATKADLVVLENRLVLRVAGLTVAAIGVSAAAIALLS